jgi:hypothetical protein
MSFTERHKPVGTVTNASQADRYHADLPHASVHVCGREGCQTKARRWVAAETNETAVFRTFEENRRQWATR